MVATVNFARKALRGPDGKAKGSMGFSIVALFFAAVLVAAFFFVTRRFLRRGVGARARGRARASARFLN